MQIYSIVVLGILLGAALIDVVMILMNKEKASNEIRAMILFFILLLPIFIYVCTR